MTTLSFSGKRLPLLAGETVLDGLLRAGEDIPHRCRSGVCRACTMVCTAGELPEAAVAGLRAVEREAGKFLACQCRPTEDLEVSLCGGSMHEAEITALDRLSESVLRVRLQPQAELRHAPGQYLSLVRSDGLARSYSLANLTHEPWLELHVRRVAGGQMSGWLFDEARVGERVQLEGPYGTCCYEPSLRERPLLMVGVGTGLAPIWGVLREALERGHEGPITVIPASIELGGLYMLDELEALAAAHPQVTLRPCVLRGALAPGVEQGAVDELSTQIVRAHGEPGGWAAYVCGDAQIVQRLRMRLFMTGVSARSIFADAFLPTTPKTGSDNPARTSLRPTGTC